MSWSRPRVRAMPQPTLGKSHLCIEVSLITNAGERQAKVRRAASPPRPRPRPRPPSTRVNTITARGLVLINALYPAPAGARARPSGACCAAVLAWSTPPTTDRVIPFHSSMFVRAIQLTTGRTDLPRAATGCSCNARIT